VTVIDLDRRRRRRIYHHPHIGREADGKWHGRCAYCQWHEHSLSWHYVLGAAKLHAQRIR
jgi:hypothetical protein